MIRVRAGTKGRLSRIASDVFDDAIDPDLLSEFLKTPGHILEIAVAPDGLVVGQCLGVVVRAVDRPPSLIIENLGVAPNWRRQGIGRGLVHAVCAEGHRQGCRTMWLGADPDSDTAAGFYRAIGLPLRHAAFAEVSLPL